MTEATIFYTDSVIPWYQSAGALEGYIWCEQNGAVVWGFPYDPNNPQPAAITPLQTGDTLADINTWIVDNIALASGIAASVYSYPGALGAGDWGTDTKPMPNSLKSRPFIAMAYNDNFAFGTMNIPLNLDGDSPRVFKYSILGFGNTESLSPAYNDIEAFVDAETANPIFQVLELHPE
jgi:hypothetical protein